MSDDGVIISLRSVAARERKNGNPELAGIIENVAKDQQEIMHINNSLRDALIQIRTVCEDNQSSACDHERALLFVRSIIARTIK